MSAVQYLRHTKTGAIFHPNEKIAARIRRDSICFTPPEFLRKIGTDQVFSWNKHLAMREDMEPVEDFITDELHPQPKTRKLLADKQLEIKQQLVRTRKKRTRKIM